MLQGPHFTDEETEAQSILWILYLYCPLNVLELRGWYWKDAKSFSMGESKERFVGIENCIRRWESFRM
jgi:hypothetical protein